MKTKAVCAALLAAITLTGSVSAAGYTFGASLLSPALATLATEYDMVKAGLVSTEIGFTGEDFAAALGYTPSSVTITSLPPASEGTLYFGTVPAAVNQQISKGNLSLLRFVPVSGCAASSFRFQGDQDYSHVCTLRFTESVNQVPLTAGGTAAAVWTQQNIGTWGTLPGTDPDGDPMRYEIVSYPLKGLITLTNTATGEYRYTPYDGAVGTDVFSYQIRDSYGNYSSVRTVEVRIDEAACDIVFADMTDHWAQNAAVVMVAENTMEVFAEGGQVYFRPEDAISREDYLVTVMKLLGAGEIEACGTVFADEDRMRPEATGYIQRAYNLGIIQGSEENGRLLFRPQDSITRAEAAVILNAILGAQTPETIPTFADSQVIPVWARPSLYALTNLGILQGTGDGCLSPESVLSRAQTAQMLLTVKNLIAGE